MARKSIETLYDTLFNMRAAMEDICQDATSLVNDVAEYGGELNRVLREQMNKYFIPSITNLIKDEKTPGSIIGLIRFMDSLPLAMTRVNATVDSVEPIVPDNANIQAPAQKTVDDVPRNASFSNRSAVEPQPQTVRPEEVHESRVKKNSRLQEAIDRGDVAKGYKPDPKHPHMIDALLADEEQPINESKEDCHDDNCKYTVVRHSTIGSSLGEDIANLEDQVVAEFDCKEEAEKRADALNRTVLPEERKLFGTKYEVGTKCLTEIEPKHFDIKKAIRDAK